MTVIWLSREEREKFAAWLEQNADSDEQLALQSEKIPGLEVFTKHERQHATLFRIVASELRAIEDATVEPPKE